MSSSEAFPPSTCRQGEWGKLGQQGATATKQGLLGVVMESRHRHSVLQVAAPLELDAHDPVHLRDTQTCQARRMPASLRPRCGLEPSSWCKLEAHAWRVARHTHDYRPHPVY